MSDGFTFWSSPLITEADIQAMWMADVTGETYAEWIDRRIAELRA